MFFCCQAKQDNNKEVYVQSIDHRNPITRRLNSKITAKKKSHPLQKSIISINVAPATTKNKSAQRPLATSVLVNEDQGLKGTHITQKTSFTAQKNRVISASRPKSGVDMMRRDGSTIEKYVHALEQSNKYLEFELSRFREESRKKYTNDLLELRDRLNKVDFSRVCKDLNLNKDSKTDHSSGGSLHTFYTVGHRP